MHINRKDVPKHILGDYEGRKIQVVVSDTYRVPADYGTDHSRQIAAFDMTTGERKPLPGSVRSPWDRSRESSEITLKQGFGIVERRYYEGKDMGLRFHVSPTMPRPFSPSRSG